MILKRFLTLNNLIMKTRKLLTILLGLFVAAMIIRGWQSIPLMEILYIYI
jgi:hypothetical protein